jgi:hypothetical protein
LVEKFDDAPKEHMGNPKRLGLRNTQKFAKGFFVPLYEL